MEILKFGSVGIGESKKTIMMCPCCGSHNVKKISSRSRSEGIYVTSKLDVYECEDCGAEWEMEHIPML